MVSFKELLALRMDSDRKRFREFDDDIFHHFDLSDSEKEKIKEKIKSIKEELLSYDFEIYKRKIDGIISSDIEVLLKEDSKEGKVAIKYFDPATGNSWTGRGKTPIWLKDKNKDDYLVKVD